MILNIKISEFDYSIYKENSPVDNVKFIIDQNFSTGHAFKNCQFEIVGNFSLSFQSASLDECVIVGLKNELNLTDNRINLSLKDCNKIEDLKIFGNFNSVHFSSSNNMKVIYLEDGASSNYYHVENSEFINCHVLGRTKDLGCFNSIIKGDLKYKAAKINGLLRFIFRIPHSHWDKKIDRVADCKNVSFDKTELNPFYLATKSPNKDSIDLSNAILVDQWSELRKKYSGLSLFIVFVLTAIFFLPLFVEYFVITSTADLSNYEALRNIKTRPFWEVLLYGRFQGNQAIIHLVITLILLGYNIARIILTISVARLREEEKFFSDANFKITSLNPEKYKVQYITHKILRVVFFFVIIYSFFKFYEAMQINVIDLSSFKLKDLLDNLRN